MMIDSLLFCSTLSIVSLRFLCFRWKSTLFGKDSITMKETVPKLTDLALFREIKLLNQCGLVTLTVASIDSLSMHLAQT